GKLGSAVQGPWGSGRLVHTTLVNVLLTNDHRLVIGSVPEAALEAALAGH
ncbi:MAG: outer membrane lipoprotein carrier protein LolA, partial [Actinomycetota bacterium]|nr:outer membrane lipoprotein carrier protein LolA [Actinomycetota bacterium]